MLKIYGPARSRAFRVTYAARGRREERGGPTTQISTHPARRPS